MANYIYLAKLTPQGIAEIKEAGKRIESFKQLLGSKGGKLIAEYATLGRYDYVIIVDLPGDQAALEVSVTTGKQGNVAFETCRAFPIEEFIQTVSRM
jgi:uncharacterized protein with GYD domain